MRAAYLLVLGASLPTALAASSLPASTSRPASSAVRATAARAGLAAEARAPRHGRVALGAAVRWDRLGDMPGYGPLFLAHYRWLTPENELKMEALAPTPGRFSFARADALVDWARAHGRPVHGHVLIGGNQLPGWLHTYARGRRARPQVQAVMDAYIRGVLGHFHGRISEWDVVNEAFDARGGWSRNLWFRQLGPGYVHRAFALARAADPGLRLCYNDGGLEGPGGHARAVFRLVTRLRRAGLLDCVGMQMHVAGAGPAPAAMQSQMRRFGATGAQVLVSEFDASVAGVSGSEQHRRKVQAGTYARVGRACARVPACVRLTTWGFTDATSWLGRRAEPLPFDARRRPKPAWRALTAALGG